MIKGNPDILSVGGKIAQMVGVVDNTGTQVNSFSGAGTQYTEGDTDTTITGTAAMWEDTSDVLRAISMAKPLPVQPGTSIAFPVTDNSGSLTIDGSVSITGSVDTELPAAGALGDATANPTAPAVGTFLHGFDGTDWERLRCDATTRRLEVEVENNPVLGAGTSNIGDVDVLTVPAPLSTTGGGTEATALRVTIASDSTGVLSVDDNAGSLTVDGTVTANAGTGTFTTEPTATLVDDAPFTPATSKVVMVGATLDDTTPDTVNEGDAGALRMTADRALHISIRDSAGNNRGVNVNASNQLSVSIDAALPAGTNAIGKLAANSGVDIGDVDVTSVVPGTGTTNLGKAEDAAHTSGDVGVGALGVRVDTPNADLTSANTEYGFVAVDRMGGVRTALYEGDFAVLGTNHVKKYYTSAGAVTDGIVWSPAAGKRWYVTDIFINVSAAATVTLEDDLVAGDSAVWKAELAANSGWSHSFHTPLFSGEDAADLLVTTSAGNVYITITGYEI